MKIFIISNTQFGYKGIVNEQVSYFIEKIIPFIKKMYRNGDIFVHGGNIFNNKKNVNMDVINDVMNIFEEISKIIPIYIIKSKNDELSILLLKRIKNVNIIYNDITIDNTLLMSYNENINNIKDQSIIIHNHDYMNNPDLYKKILENFNISICTCYEDAELYDDNIINIGSPYQLNKTHKNQKGFLVIDTIKKKKKLVENNYSPKFIDLFIENIDGLNKIKILKKDFINIKINESILLKKENLNKFNLFINRHNFSNITYINNNNDSPPSTNLNIDTQIFNIKNVVTKYIKDNNIDVGNELENIYKIYNEKYLKN